MNPNPVFKVRPFLDAKYITNGYRYGHSYYTILATDQATSRLQIVPPGAQSGGWPCAIHTWLVCWLQSPMSHRGLLFELRPTAIMSSPEPVWNSVRWRSPLLLLKHGIGCQQNSSWCVPRQLSSAAWKHSSSTVTSSSDRSNLDNVMRRRSSCRRRTKSTVDLIWFIQKANRKPHLSFWMAPLSVTLSDL